MFFKFNQALILYWVRCLHIYFTLLLASLFSPKSQWEFKWYCKPFVGEIDVKCLDEIQSYNECFNSRLSWTNLKCFSIPVQIALFCFFPWISHKSSQIWDLVMWALEQYRHIWNVQILQRCQDWPTLVKKSACYLDSAKKFVSHNFF